MDTRFAGKKEKKLRDSIMREEQKVDKFLSKSCSIHHTKKGCYISILGMLTAAAGFKDHLRNFVGLSTEVIRASV